MTKIEVKQWAADSTPEDRRENPHRWTQTRKCKEINSNFHCIDVEGNSRQIINLQHLRVIVAASYSYRLQVNTEKDTIICDEITTGKNKHQLTLNSFNNESSQSVSKQEITSIEPVKK